MILFPLIHLYFDQQFYLIMRKQAYYLPNLNELLIKNRQYMRHRQKIQFCKSQYQTNKLSPIKHRKQFIKMQLMKIPLQEEAKLSIDTTTNISIHDKRYRFEPSPYERRKLQQQQRQNIRLSKAMELSTPAINNRSKKQYEHYSAVKQKMKYYAHDAGKVVYKFKKSLLEILDQRQRKVQHGNDNREKKIKENAKQRLQVLLQQSSQMNSIRKVTETVPNDIFYNDGESINLLSISSSQQIKQRKKYSKDHSRANQEYYRHLSIYSNGNTVQNSNKQLRYNNERQIRMKTLNSSLNPQARAMIKQRQRNIKTDLQIVEMIPVSNY